ncbi:MAG: carbohydrate ABC transporter permease [Ardenticatenales bacterium]|nr:carbohydrate ABC transporter permease [Ardenticatenales bacterium]
MAQHKNPLVRGLFWFIVVLIFFYTMFPFYWTLNSSLKTEAELLQTPATFFPQNPTLQNYRAVFNNEDFLNGLKNSLIVSISTVLVSLVIGSFAAYALGKLRFRGKGVWLYLILAMTMFPQISILSSLYTIIKNLQLNATLGMVLSYMIFTLPFTVWVLTSFFKALPDELLQAAEVDGATPFEGFYKVLLPLTAPAMVTTGLLAFISAWNEYLFALTFTSIQPSARTVPVAIALFTGEVARQEPFGEIMAAAVVVTIPLIALVLVFQRRIVEGLTAGAVKG